MQTDLWQSLTGLRSSCRIVTGIPIRHAWYLQQAVRSLDRHAHP